MALSINYNLSGNAYVQGVDRLILVTNNFNLSLTNAYVKIINLNGNKSKVSLNIGIYDAKDGDLVSTDYYEFTPDLTSTSKNFLQQGYEQLKNNKYTNAVDVLEEGQTV